MNGVPYSEKGGVLRQCTASVPPNTRSAVQYDTDSPLGDSIEETETPHTPYYTHMRKGALVMVTVMYPWVEISRMFEGMCPSY